jgi:hypothetical protein
MGRRPSKSTPKARGIDLARDSGSVSPVKTVALANQTRVTQTFNLPSDVVPELATRGIVGTRAHNAKTGERAVQAVRKWISGSVTLLPKGTPGDIVRGLPLSVLQAPDVKRALGAWPPKIAAKILEPAERAAEEKKAGEVVEKQKAAEEAAKKLAATKAAKRAAAPVVAPTETKPARVARAGKE